MKIFYFDYESEIKLGININDNLFMLDKLKFHLPDDCQNKEYYNPRNFRFHDDITFQFKKLKDELSTINLKNIKQIENNKIIYMPPSPFPSKIICLGLNYADHAKEVERPIPSKPNLFSKGSNTLIGHKQSIKIPQVSKDIDYEAELAIIIGKRGRDISASKASEYILGYTIMNDVTARDVEFEQGIQWFRSKSFDTFAPMGPYILIDDKINPNKLNIKLWVNEELRQNSNTNKMIFNCNEIVSYISKDTTLYPGDIISTGTPPGIGMKQKPSPKYLKKGDTVKIEIEKIGQLINKVV
jgi:2-keto-4-pentenoate hydratase/2-oxohepta-3-ene-1,7-dioic acid hydratase in catechol pathway